MSIPAILSEQERRLKAQELLENHRRLHVQSLFPADLVENTTEDPMIKNWGACPKILRALRHYLPFGEYLTHTELRDFLVEELPKVVEACQGQMLYWHLSGATDALNAPVEELLITEDDDHFWFTHIPTVAHEIRDSIHQSERVFYLGLFFLGQRQIELMFHEIRLVRNPPPMLEDLVITRGHDYHYSWTERVWQTIELEADPRLIDPPRFSRPPVPRNPNEENQVAPVTALEELFQDNLPVTPEEVFPAATEEPLPQRNENTAWRRSGNSSYWNTQECFCRKEVCECGFRPRTPPTPEGIVLWAPGNNYLPSHT